MKKTLVILFSLVLCFYLFTSAVAQNQEDGHIFRAKVRQVGLSLSIPGLTNGAVAKLKKENFRVWEKIKNGKNGEDRQEQEIINFAIFKDQPVAMIVAIDSSESMNPGPQQTNRGYYGRTGDNKLIRAKVGAKDLIENVFRNTDLGLIAEFFTETYYNDEGKIANGGIRYFYVNQDWTKNKDALSDGIKNIGDSLGATPIRQAIYLLAEQFLNEKISGDYLRVMVVVSDGLESESVGGILGKLSNSDVIKKLEDNQILVYSVGLYERESLMSSILPGTNTNNILEDAAYATGGRAFFGGELNKLPKIFAEIEDSIRNIVYLSYAPKSDIDGPREIVVEMGSIGNDGKWNKSNSKNILHRRGYTHKKDE